MNYVAAFILSFVLSLALVPLVRKLAFRIGAIDKPVPNSRKKHTKTMARAGGLALYTSFFVTCFIFLPTFSIQFWGLVAAATFVLMIGLIDDVKSQSPWVKLAVQVLAALIAIAAGIKIGVVSNLSGGFIDLSSMTKTLSLGPLSISLSMIASTLSLLWLVGMTNTVNFLDGLDGLATGVVGIAASVMFILSVSSKVNQPYTAILAIALAGACFGFLWHNFHPASIFIGDSGAYFLGMTLGILAIISGAKLATAFLVLGLPILDAVWAIIRRTISGKSPFSADRGHIHYMLIDAGLSQKQTVLLIYAFSIAFGAVALVGDTQEKLIAMIVLLALTAVLLTVLHTQHARTTKAARKQAH